MLLSRTPGSLLGVLLLLCSPALLAADCIPGQTLQAVQVRQVIDGDTLRLSDGRSLRLIGIDTPELGRDGAPDEPLARAATDKVRRLLSEDRQVFIHPGQEPRDRYGRLLANVFLSADGDSLEQRLLQAGLGWQVVVPPNTQYADCLSAAEQRARRSATGVWAVAEYRPLHVSQLKPGQGGFLRIRGRVSKVAETRQVWWVELDGRVSLRLAKSDLPNFGQLNPADWRGQELVVRGWLVYRGDNRRGFPPHIMHLRHPVMLETAGR